MQSTFETDGKFLIFTGIWSKTHVLNKSEFWPHGGSRSKVNSPPKLLQYKLSVCTKYNGSLLKSQGILLLEYSVGESWMSMQIFIAVH